MKFLYINCLIFGFFFIIQSGFAQSSNCNREAIINDYKESILNTEIIAEDLNWTGNVSSCEAGNISAIAKTNTLKRINYFRRLVGVADNISWNTTKSDKSQEAALMMKANNNISHSPPSSWQCYSADGAEAASKSLLALGSHAVNAIPLFMESKSNQMAAHRRWVLYHKAATFGVGSTDNSAALWSIEFGAEQDIVPEYIAYPAPGYFPKPLVYNNWSFSIPGANFVHATVEMFDELDSSVSLTQYEVTNNVGDNSIVWQPEINLDTAINGTDLLFTVKISDVLINENYEDFEYQVLIIDPQYTGPQFSISGTECGEENGSIGLEFDPGYSNIIWSNGESGQSKIEDLSTGTYEVTITDKLGCNITKSVTLHEDKAPAHATITPEGDSINLCSYKRIKLTAHGGDTYQWSNGSSLTSIFANAEGNYTVTITNSEGCSDTAAIFINAIPQPAVDTILGNTTPEPDTPEVYQIEQHTGSSYKWAVIGGHIVEGIDSSTVKVSWFNQTGTGDLCVTEINEYDCESEAYCLEVSIVTTDVHESNQLHKLSIFPNPVKDILQIRLSGKVEPDTPLEIKLFNMAGERVYHKTGIINYGRTALDISHLQAGTYFLQTLSGKDNIIRKVVKL